MSDTTPSSSSSPVYGAVKTLAVRLSEDVRAQLDVIAQLLDHTVTEEIRIAVDERIAKVKSDPAVLRRAESVRADIERDAETKRNAISAIFDGKTPTGNRGTKKE